MKRNSMRFMASMIAVSMSLNLATGVFADASQPTKMKNVILMIPDGMPVTATTLARWYKGGQPLNMDELACGLIRTYSADAAIADSAPAGTAMATGYKSHTGFVGVLPEQVTMPLVPSVKAGDEKKPIATILEAARLMGKSTGLIATSEITHATPADFSAHVDSRKNYDDIGEQIVYQNVDVVLGAGSKFLTSEYRKDKEDLVKIIKSKGYDYITSVDALKSSKSQKIWGMFAEENLSYDFDRNPANQPSLSDMTTKAIDVLSKDKDGFFLMVEGSKIDWADHANDPIGSISDVLAFDKAVKIALDFAKKDKNTVVIVASDHATGGMSIGNSNTNSTYDKAPLSDFIAPLKKAILTGEGLESKLNADKSNVVEVMKQYYGLDDLKPEEIEAIKTTKDGSMNYTVGPMMSKRANIGWTTTGHTGEEVVLYVYNPNQGDRLTGVVQNTDIAKYMARLLGVDFAKVNRDLFVEANKAFALKSATSTVLKDTPNVQLVVVKGNNKLVIEANKNVVVLNGVTKVMPGIAVYSGDKFYVSKSTIDLIK